MRNISKKKFEDFSNSEIKNLEIDLQRAKNEVDLIAQKIQIIRGNCDHEFEFFSSNMYEKTYRCANCGAYYVKG